jgi:hypothetical protein
LLNIHFELEQCGLVGKLVTGTLHHNPDFVGQHMPGSNDHKKGVEGKVNDLSGHNKIVHVLAHYGAFLRVTTNKKAPTSGRGVSSWGM